MEQKEYDLIDLVRFCWSVWVRYAWNPLVYLFRFALQKWYVLLVAAIIGVGIHVCLKRAVAVSYSSEMNIYYAIDTPTELINKVNSLNNLSQAERAQLLGLSQEDANEWERVSPYFMLKSKEITGLYTVDYDNKCQQDHALIAPHILCLQVVTKHQFANTTIRTALLNYLNNDAWMQAKYNDRNTVLKQGYEANQKEYAMLDSLRKAGSIAEAETGTMLSLADNVIKTEKVLRTETAPIILLSATTVSPLNNAAIMGMKGCVAGVVFLVYVLLLIVHFRKEIYQFIYPEKK